MSSLVVDPLFNRQETPTDRKVEGQTSTVVTELLIDTALPLVLTQDVAKKDLANHQFIPPTCDLKVFGDEVTISGALRLPSRLVTIFARVLRGEPGRGGEAPAIVVDGAPLPHDKALPAGLNRGDWTEDKPPKQKLAAGSKGPEGWSRSIGNDDKSPGGKGGSRKDAPALMDGAGGRNGDPGNAAGNVWICCERTDFGKDVKLLVSAVGGRGGNGQPGQPGGNGGPGGDGFKGERVTFGILSPTDGGPGGDGGNGGPGGSGGQGGKGGDVVIHCIAAMPPITVTNGGGAGGDPGDGGARGEGGEGGQGGHSVTYRRVKVPRANNGARGQPGAPGNRGGPAPPSTAGGGSVKTGKLENADLAARASVIQLHMMLERTRAIYLVTEPPTYRLRQVMITAVDQLPPTGRNLVVLALMGLSVHVRVFDAAGAKVVDKAEKDLPAGELLEKVRNRFEFEIGRVLVAGKWLTPRQRDEMPTAQQRELLCKALGEWSNNTKTIPDFYRKLDDAALAGSGAMVVFMRDMRIRDEAGMKASSDDGQRNTLITENGRTRRPDLQGLHNSHNVRLALGWCGRRDLREAFLSRSGDEEQQIISEVFALAGYVDNWAGIGQRLDWAQSLLTNIPSSHVQKPLARTLADSAWSAVLRHRAGLDYFGNSPSFVPVLSLREYSAHMQDALASLTAIETKRNAYLQAGNDQAVRRNQLADTLAGTGTHIAYLDTRRTPIEKNIAELNDAIGKQNTQIANLGPDLLTKLRAFESQVKDSFGLSPETFFNCLSQLSFMSAHTPANPTTFVERYGGPMSAVAMGSSQVGAMITEGVKNLLSDSGDLVNKDYVLTEVDVVRKGLDLRAELARRGGFFQKGASARLLVELDRFRELVNQFHSRLTGAANLIGPLDKYISLVTSRNQNVDDYNFLVRDLADLVAEKKRLTLQKQEAEGLLARAMDPGAPVMTTFVSQLYDRAKEQCVQQLYMASRALSFWALRPYSQFFDLIGRSPGAVTVEQLRSGETGFMNNVLEALKENGRPPSFFPKSEASESSLGQVVILTADAHTDFFNTLRDKQRAEFTLEPATFASSTPKSPFDPTVTAWSGDARPDVGQDAPNPFHGMANVRLTKVRVWLLTDKPSNTNHKLVFIHLGREQFRKRNDEPFPARTDPADEPDLDLRRHEFVEHDPVPIPFEYDATGMQLDLAKSPPVFTPGRMRENTHGTVDGDLDFPDDRSLSKLAASSYAPIGPFGRWRLVVHPNENPDLDLNDVNRILIDFHGYFHSYKVDSDPDTA